jgi:CheY-like chemotaxis protein
MPNLYPKISLKVVNTICVIDDDNIYQFAIRLTIRQMELAQNVITFSNGELARDFFLENLFSEEALPDVILLDINMPVMDGWGFLDWFTEQQNKLPKAIPVFMVSSSIDWRDMEKAKGYPSVIDYLSKPLTEGNLYDIVSRVD